MSEQMPRIWWSPRWDEFYILAEPFVSRLNNTDDLPGDAVELQPVSGDIETEWAVHVEDSEGPVILHRSTEAKARDTLDYFRFGPESGCRNWRLMRRTVSGWQEVTDA